MELNVIRNNDENWTIQKLENVQRSAKSLGVKNTEDEVLDMKKRILEGELIPVVFPQERDYKENHQIILDEVIAGNITTRFYEYDNEWEIDIFVYEGFEGRGIAYQALSQLIQQYSDRKWIANVLENNPNLIRIENTLLKLGFKTDGMKIPNGEGVPVQEYYL